MQRVFGQPVSAGGDKSVASSVKEYYVLGYAVIGGIGQGIHFRSFIAEDEVVGEGTAQVLILGVDDFLQTIDIGVVRFHDLEADVTPGVPSVACGGILWQCYPNVAGHDAVFSLCVKHEGNP